MASKSEITPQAGPPSMTVTFDDIFKASDIVVRGNENPRGIPAMPFVTDIDQFMKTQKIETIIELINARYQQYRFMERSLSNKAVLLERKVPEIQSTLKALDHLIAKKNAQVELTMDFLLSENVYSQAVVDNTGKVGIWLGANVMVEYSYDEAKALLERNLDGAEKQLKSVDDDLLFLKAQITTSEVAIARFFNFDVKQRRQLRAIQEKEDAAKK